jgi:hypothetical protein
LVMRSWCQDTMRPAPGILRDAAGVQRQVEKKGRCHLMGQMRRVVEAGNGGVRSAAWAPSPALVQVRSNEFAGT